MSYFVDISEKCSVYKSILSELRKRNIDLGKVQEINLKKQEKDFVASIVGLKPTGMCKLDGGCTLDRSLRLGSCNFAGIVTLVIFEDEKTPKKVSSKVKTKLESKGLLVAPIGKEVAASNWFQNAISRYREYYITNKFEDKEFDERRNFREGVYRVIVKDWDEVFSEKDAEGLLDKA